MTTSYKLKTGIGKSGKNWYMITFIIDKFQSEPVFISQLEYDYLLTLTDFKTDDYQE